MAWLLKKTEFNTFIGKKYGLTVMNTLRETRVSGVPGREGVGGICACINRVEMSRN